MAKMKNPDLVIYMEKIKQTEEQKKYVAADLYPQITGEAVPYERTKTASLGSGKDTYEYGATGKQLLFDGFKTIYKTDAGKWKMGEDVRIVKVGNEEFIRTDANSKAADNLGNLPEF